MNSKNKLWTRDFSIITLGSVVSMLGNSMVGFSISLFVLDYTDTPFFFALYVFLYTLPQIAAPILAGPLMDRFSRRRTIYMLDFTSAALYLIMGALIYLKFFNFGILAVMVLIIGTINSVYAVAFNSFYPMLITEGNYSKAYSVSSTLETLSYVMIPVATFLYKSFGILPILMVNSVCFLIAALFETRISNVESASGDHGAYSAKSYIADSKEGIRYLISEKGLLFIALYFMFSSLAGGASYVITLPWFRESFENGEYVYMSVWAFMLIGRVAGGMMHYKWRIPAKAKFVIALCVYILASAFEGLYLFAPLNVMRMLCFMIGILSATSYNIRVSATQAYVPDAIKGRFNGAFLMLTTFGSLLGELSAGVVITFVPMRIALSCFMGLCIIAALVFVGGGGKHIKPIFNRIT